MKELWFDGYEKIVHIKLKATSDMINKIPSNKLATIVRWVHNMDEFDCDKIIQDQDGETQALKVS